MGNITHDNLAGTRILIVEDSADTQSMYEVYLRHRGMLVASVSNGEAALALIPSFLPAIIVTDIGLPRMTGVQLAQRLKAEPRTEHIPLIAVSGFGQAPRFGFDAFLRKPCLPADLARVVSDLLDARRHATRTLTSPI